MACANISQLLGNKFIWCLNLDRLSPVKGESHKLSKYHEETAKKKEFALKKLAQTVSFHVNRRHEVFCCFIFNNGFELHA